MKRVTWLSDDDLHLFSEGTHLRLSEKLGAHPSTHGDQKGTRFAVWAPNAQRVSVAGDWNGWSWGKDVLDPQGSTGIHAGFIPGVGAGAKYKYAIESRVHGYRVLKADPYAFYSEVAPGTASIVWELGKHQWRDGEWMSNRGRMHALDAPISVYEVHLGSWRRKEDNKQLGYREVAPLLAKYTRDLGYTHIELMPITEHPFEGSWGYQTTGYFAPTSRFGTPDDFMFFVDTLHQAGVGVILDWVPAHFPRDEHGLAFFDGTHLYEHADPKQGEHPDWGTKVFNFGRREVANFLIGNALFWLRNYHVDGLRIDAVASMLYLDYSRKEGEWVPNIYGGREHLEAIGMIRRANEIIYQEHPDAMTIAEESTAWPMVSRPTYLGGLGFGYKWDMGWMHDMLAYMKEDPINRRYHQDKLTFRMIYAFFENFTLALSHDEVVHGKGSLWGKMPGDEWQKRANLRLLYAAMYGQPGKKLLFMGAELGQQREWNHDAQLEWNLLEDPGHAGIHRLIGDLNRLYRSEPTLHQRDCDARGFEWVDCSDSEQSIAIFQRKGTNPNESIIFAFNFTPVPRHNYRVGVPWAGKWEEILNTDAPIYGGSGQGNLGGATTAPVGWHGQAQSLNLVLPPLAAIVLKGKREAPLVTAKPRPAWVPGLGAVPAVAGGAPGARTRFRVWATSAKKMEVLAGGQRHVLAPLGGGVFEASVDGIGQGDEYRLLADGEKQMPDPASRDARNGSSVVVDAGSFSWSDESWTGVPLGSLVLERVDLASFESAHGALSALRAARDLGATGVLLAPVHDDKLPFAPSVCTPDALRGLVDTAHGLGLAVHLELRLGKLSESSPAVQLSPEIFGGGHLALDKPQVRALLAEQALSWAHEYHLDALHAIDTRALEDKGPHPFIAELGERLHASAKERPVMLIGDDARDLTRALRPTSAQGWGLDGVATSDLDHFVEKLLAGEPPPRLGRPELPPRRILQQVTAAPEDPDVRRAIAALLLTSPETPVLSRPAEDVLSLHRALLALRSTEPALRDARPGSWDLRVIEKGTVMLRRTALEGPSLIVAAALRGAPAVSIEPPRTSKGWSLAFSTEDPAHTPNPKPPKIDLGKQTITARFARPGAIILRSS